MGRRRIYQNEQERRVAACQYVLRHRARRRNGDAPYPRHDFDLYETPCEVIEAVLDIVTIEPASVLDVGAHDGRWGQLAKSRWPNAAVDGVELREMPVPAEFRRWYTGNFLEGAKWLPSYDLVIGNPPYALAEEFARAALSLLAESGECCFLLQSQFLHSKGRREGLFTQHPLRRIYPLAGRVQYHSGRGGTRDATAFLWQRGYFGPEEICRGRY